jgi:hypothetical protein
MFSTSKVKKSKKFIWGYPMEFAGSTQNHDRLTGTPSQLIKSKIDQKKQRFSTSIVKRNQKFVSGFPMEFVPSVA